MTQNIRIEPVPNQKFTTTIDGNRYTIEIKEVSGVMCITIVRNNITIISGQKIVAGYPVIPYTYLEDGNFIFTSLNEEIIDYRKFGSTQLMIYASQAEIEAVRNA